MRNFNFFLIITFLLSSAHSLFAQSKLDSNKVYSNGNKFYYMNHMYSYKELGPQFMDYSEFIKQHQKALRKDKSAAILGGITIGIGLWGAALANDCEDLGCLALIFHITVVPITGTIALIQKISSRNIKIKSISTLNYLLGKDDLSVRESSSLSLAVGTNGFGIVYRF